MTLSLDNLLALDAQPAEAAATAMLAEQILHAPAFQPLVSVSVQALSEPAIADRAWTDRLATAALQRWLSASGIGWVSEQIGSSDHACAFDTLLSPGDTGHAAAAEALYHWALPSHCRGEGTILLSYLLDSSRPWGDELAEFATSPHFVAATAALPEPQRARRLASLLGKLNWLAPQRSLEVQQALGAVLPLSDGKPTTGFRFSSEALLDAINPVLAEALHSMLNAGALSRLCGFELSSALNTESALIEAEAPVPLLTETILQERFAELSGPEQQMLAGALIHALPLLRKAIGEFVDPVIRRLAAQP